jgi:DNA repair exonuclease SbcCD ATPase subunit
MFVPIWRIRKFEKTDYEKATSLLLFVIDRFYRYSMDINQKNFDDYIEADESLKKWLFENKFQCDKTDNDKELYKEISTVVGDMRRFQSEMNEAGILPTNVVINKLVAKYRKQVDNIIKKVHQSDES